MATFYNPKIVTNGLILFLDAFNIKSYPQTGTAWTDLSGRGNNATLSGSPLFSTNYLTMDGLDDQASISSWSWPSETTVCLLLQLFSANGGVYSRIMSTGNADNFEIGFSSTNQISYYTAASTWVNNVVTLSASWNFLVFSQSGSSLTIYVNGVPAYTGSLTTTAGNNLFFGRSHAASAPGNIRLSQVQIYNRGLTASEVSQNFNTVRGRFSI